jgi:hypothetical protein
MSKSKWIISFLIFVFIIYGLFRAENFLQGPKIIIDSPQNGQVFTTADIEVSGQARNISLLYLNDRQIFTDQNGNFKEIAILANGYNILELTAKDKFGREIRENLELVLK